MKSRSLRFALALALVLSFFGGSPAVEPALAASFTVDTTNDTNDSNMGDGLCADLSGNCSLRAAILEANALPGADSITLPAGTYTLTSGEQLPSVTSEITLDGAGSGSTIIQANAAANTATYRVFHVASTGVLTLNDVTVRHGRCNGSCAGGGGFASIGGGLLTEGEVTINGSTIAYNTASTFGGGIYHSYQYFEKLTINNSLLSNNTATQNGGAINTNGILEINASTFSNNTAFDGGAIYKIGSGAFDLTGSTFTFNSTVDDGSAIFFWMASDASISDTEFTQNSAGDAGAVHSDASSPTLNRVTFDSNTAGFGGGGMANYLGSTSTVTNSTFTANSALYGGGMYNYYASSPVLTNLTFSGNAAANSGGGMFNYWVGSSPLLNNVIIANSTSGGDCVQGSDALNPASANNLIEDSVNTCGLINGANGNITGQDPNLGPLADNGGATRTHALVSPSPAVDAGAGCPATDQRGIPRPQGAACDIGAYELDASPPTVLSTSLMASYPSGAGPSAFTVTFSEDVEDPAGDSGSDDVTNPANYRVVESGANSVFNTASCAGGLAGDDTLTAVSSVAYNPTLYQATVSLPGSLADGQYRLFVCGTTSVVDLSGNALNGGADFTFDFTVGVLAAALPETGFAPGRVAALPPQPADRAYTGLGDLWLEIPSLNVRSSVVGVPRAEGQTWDVSWLGNATGWLHGTAFPTWNGNSVLTAHAVNASGLPGPFEALEALRFGDHIIIHMGDEQYVYEVRASRLARPTSTTYALQSLQDHAYLTLITCQVYDPWSETYLFRRLVRAVLVGVR
jgi:LPXTG-site transpeptidase (sortase) family protein